MHGVYPTGLTPVSGPGGRVPTPKPTSVFCKSFRTRCSEIVRASIWCYARNGGDARLQDRFSAGVGGHIDETDAAESIGTMAERALLRELQRSFSCSRKSTSRSRPPGSTRNSQRSDEYIGLLYVLCWREDGPPQPVEGQGLKGIGFVPAERIMDDLRFELWSRLAADFLIRNSA